MLFGHSIQMSSEESTINWTTLQTAVCSIHTGFVNLVQSPLSRCQSFSWLMNCMLLSNAMVHLCHQMECFDTMNLVKNAIILYKICFHGSVASD